MQFLFICVLCFCLNELGIILCEQEVGEQCFTSSGEKGTCTPQNECVELANSTPDTEFSETCKLNPDGMPVICCVADPRQTGLSDAKFSTTPSDNDTNENRFYNGPKKKQKQMNKISTFKYPYPYDYEQLSNNQYKKPAGQNYQNNDFSNSYNGQVNKPNNVHKYVSSNDNYGNHQLIPAEPTQNDDKVYFGYDSTSNNYDKTTRPNYYRPNNNNYVTTLSYKYKTTHSSLYSLPSNNNVNSNSQTDSSIVFPDQYRPSNGQNVNSANRPTNSNRPSNNKYPTAIDNNPPVWESRPEDRTTRKIRTTKSTPTLTNDQQPNSRPFSTNKQKRISERKCEEYSKIVTEILAPLPLQFNSHAVSKEVPNCPKIPAKLIVGGTKANLGEFPHMAALGFRSGTSISYNCGGTIISEEYVVTAAHCMHSSLGHPVHVRLGDLNLARDDDGARPQIINVTNVTVHHNYKAPQLYNDIALIKLSRPILFDKTLRPACLQINDYINNNVQAIASGWGTTNYGEISSDDLLKVGLNVIDHNLCNSLYDADDRLRTGIAKSMLCAGDISGNKDTCQGDSGGPLQIHSPSNKCIYYIIGITSFGRACGVANSPGIYTRVSDFVPWIESIVWRNL